MPYQLMSGGSLQLGGELLTCSEKDTNGRCVKYLPTCRWPGECLTESPAHPTIPGRKAKNKKLKKKAAAKKPAAVGGLEGALLTCAEWQVIGAGAIRCKKYVQTCLPGDADCAEPKPKPKKQAKAKEQARELQLSGKEEKVFNAVNEKPAGVHIDAIRDQTGLEAYDISAALVMLELKGVVRQRAGKIFELVKPGAQKLTVAVKRVKFPKGSSEAMPATDKQIAYLTDLFVAKKLEGIGKEARDTERAFWVKAELPHDLSFWEATNLINLMKNRSSFNIYQLGIGAVKARMQKKKVTSADTHMVILAFSESARWIADELKQRTLEETKEGIPPGQEKPKPGRSWMKTSPISLPQKEMNRVLSWHTETESEHWKPAATKGHWHIQPPGAETTQRTTSTDEIMILADGRSLNVFSHDVYLGRSLCKKRRETAKAVLFRFQFTSAEGEEENDIDIWIPKSQILETDGVWVLRDWLVKDKFGIGPALGWPLSLYHAMGGR